MMLISMRAVIAAAKFFISFPFHPQHLRRKKRIGMNENIRHFIFIITIKIIIVKRIITQALEFILKMSRKVIVIGYDVVDGNDKKKLFRMSC